MYSVFVAADCNGEKVNLQFLFEFGPSVAQVLSRATEAFRILYRQRDIDKLFTISASVIFNDATSTWDRLERSTQLVHNCQLYLFQPDILDIPAEIGDPIPASMFLGDYISPARDKLYASPRPQPPLAYDPRPSTTVYSSPMVHYESSGNTYYSSAFAVEASPNPYNLAFSSRYDRTAHTIQEGNDSILRQEREKVERQSRMPLDEMRAELRREAKEFSASPERHH